MLQVFILIVTNHRKNNYCAIYCQIFAKLSTADFFSMWRRIIGAQQQID